MTSYEFGEIVLIAFPQTGTMQKKKRPALVILDIGDADVVLAPITTKERNGPGDCKLIDWRSAGLLKESWVRLAKIACLEKDDVVRRLGSLSEGDKETIADLLRAVYAFPRGK